MKTINICGKEYNIDCNALTYVKYKTFFKTGILKDLQFVKDYLIRQTVVAKQFETKQISENEKLRQVSNYMIEDTDELVVKITQIAWILMYTADNKVDSYEKWLASITDFKIDADWIAEVTEFAVNCFC